MHYSLSMLLAFLCTTVTSLRGPWGCLWPRVKGLVQGRVIKVSGLDCSRTRPPFILWAQAIAAGDINAALRIKVKRKRGAAMGRVEQRVMEQLTKEGRARWRAELAAAVAKLEGSLDREKVRF